MSPARIRVAAKSALIVLAASFCVFGTGKPKGPRLPKEWEERFAYVPMGAASMEGRTITTLGFFIAKWEVSNSEYREFTRSIKEKGDTALYRSLLPDTLQWTFAHGAFEPQVRYYFYHPAYRDYPVVNITEAGAVAYCRWLEDRINATPGLSVRVKCELPSREQWVMAGWGGRDYYPYAWGNRLMNEHAQPLCKYQRIGDERITGLGDSIQVVTHFEDWFSDGFGHYDRKAERRSRRGVQDGEIPEHRYEPTVYVRAYPPNAFGLYNMCGNVAEMIDSAGVAVGGGWMSTGYDVRLLSTMTYEHPTPWIGFRPILEIVKE